MTTKKPTPKADPTPKTKAAEKDVDVSFSPKLTEEVQHAQDAPKDADVAPEKAEPKQDAKPSEPTVPQEVIAAFEQGRTARRSAIGRFDAPHGEGEALKEWQRGWDFEDKGHA